MAKKRRIKNPVARVLDDMNQCVTHRDRKNDYRRKSKHTKKDLGPFALSAICPKWSTNII